MKRNQPDQEAISREADSRTVESALFNLARAYAETAKLATQKIFADKNADFAGPAIMCKSFAVELLLKFFIAVDYPRDKSYADLKKIGLNLYGHSYADLFEKIKDRYQKKICKAYSDATSTKVDAQAFKLILIEIGNDPFVSWRYLYEDESTRHLNIQLFDNVLDSIGEAAASERRRLHAEGP